MEFQRRQNINLTECGLESAVEQRSAASGSRFAHWRIDLQRAAENILRTMTAANRSAEQHENFKQMAQPYINEAARAGLPPALFISGLGRTTYPWRDTADALHALFGCRTEVYSLKGHAELTEGLRRVCHHDWVNDIREKIVDAGSSGHKPVVFTISTGALAAVRAIAELKRDGGNREPVQGLAIVAAPFELSRQWDRVRILIAEAVVRQLPALGEKITASIAVKFGPAGGLVEESERTPAHPRLNIPVKTFLDLEYLRREVSGLLGSITYPVLMMHGGRDKYTTLEDARSSFGQIGCSYPNKRFVTFPESPHHIMLGSERGRFIQIVQDWFSDFAQAGADGSAAWGDLGFDPQVRAKLPELSEGSAKQPHFEK